MEFIISKFHASVEILKSSATFNFAWQKSGGAMAPKSPPVLPGLFSICSESKFSYRGAFMTSLEQNTTMVGENLQDFISVMARNAMN